jgi:hypothetical protein
MGLALALVQPLAGNEAAEFESPCAFPLMGDWSGQWINPKGGHEEHHPDLAAQVLPVGDGLYRVAILPELYTRAEPYLDTVAAGTPERLAVEQGGYQVVFEDGKATGEGMLHGQPTRFELTKTEFLSPTLGLNPPEGAIVLFDGSGTDEWKHTDDRPFSWTLRDGILEVNSAFWNGGQNDKDGIGGMIASKQSFGSFRLHLEFRYPVEAGKTGQERGNSGLFLHPVGEIQILNSYMTPGYWDECGAIYRRVPAKVNAAGPPLQWQAYDVELVMLPNSSECELTVRLNGHLIHNRTRLSAPSPEVTLMLQDHINRVQFRNIWVLPLDAQENLD